MMWNGSYISLSLLLINMISSVHHMCIHHTCMPNILAQYIRVLEFPLLWKSTSANCCFTSYYITDFNIRVSDGNFQGVSCQSIDNKFVAYILLRNLKQRHSTVTATHEQLLDQLSINANSIGNRNNLS